MPHTQIPVYIPAELEYRLTDDFACLRFHYHLENNEPLPNSDQMFTGLTIEQAKDTIEFLQKFVLRAESIRAQSLIN
ncbi:hypothetical protein K9W22_003316 [Salmonella enterica subsp. enterica serovar Durham]|nr:hypothetical protein [Salmonella enterica subsp. enterica serovar Tudu]EEA8731937.1 hypothetical protein [Salmonella enterica subsp. enterica serovar Agbeni]EGI5714391.1 hypothetical protein [Salmonella enterica subsp. enterica serovar Durham]EJN2865028.1 hypothetical protein [Salmonella enterica subsp. enterica serovar Yaba]MLP05853.1 hypothetical protein [Salmonella enterica subsp. enterica serovar Kedougou]